MGSASLHPSYGWLPTASWNTPFKGFRSGTSYFTARPSRTLLGAAHQQITRDWWEGRRQDFDLFISELVLLESSSGDAEAARRRLEVLQGIPRLDLDDRVYQISRNLVSRAIIPRKAAEDAVHIAVATVHGMDYLLTWNCKHIANPQIQSKVANYLAGQGWLLPYICIPEELLGDTGASDER
jgi:hypothetical protein